jgi:hypothetical protein
MALHKLCCPCDNPFVAAGSEEAPVLALPGQRGDGPWVLVPTRPLRYEWGTRAFRWFERLRHGWGHPRLTHVSDRDVGQPVLWRFRQTRAARRLGAKT